MKIQELFIEAGRTLRREFDDIKATNPHFGESGAEAEIILRDFLNNHLPKRFAAETGIVIDEKNQISMQSDILVYDADNSPVYRKGGRVMILPSDNVASVIEVKSRLNKKELGDAAKKIASVKGLKKSLVNDMDQPVTMSHLLTTQSLGIVFAYESSTSLETLSKNLAEINSSYPSSQWIDMVVILDKGVIYYAVKTPFSTNLSSWGGTDNGEFDIPPFYVEMGLSQLGELSLNKFFGTLMTHLMFYRKRSYVNLDNIMGQPNFDFMVVQGYQFNLHRQLVNASQDHLSGNFKGPKVLFNIFLSNDHKLVGQIGYLPFYFQQRIFMTIILVFS